MLSNQLTSFFDQMHEDLLTPDEIQQVLEESQKPDWLDPNFMGLMIKKTSILKVLPSTGLILVTGNKDTGCKHIQYRHQFGRQVWNEDKETLSQASEIRYGVAPIDYIRLAESVYKPENLQEQLPKFDKYQGIHVYKNGDPASFRLLTYSGTGIIHTLYPLKSDNPRKKMFPYHQGGASYQHDTRKAVHTYKIPYSNKAGNILFKLVIRGINRYPIERFYVEVNEDNAILPQTIFIKDFDLKRPIEHGVSRMIILEDGDKSDLEKTALEVIKGNFDATKEIILCVAPGRLAGPAPTFFTW